MKNRFKISGGADEAVAIEQAVPVILQSRAEVEGFEPPDPGWDQRFSRPSHSTALAHLLLKMGYLSCGVK